jgi:hypothetical protein
VTISDIVRTLDRGGSLDGVDCLREAIRTVPVPGAPPRFSRDGAVAGLAFLDASLRLNHVRRLTERLSFVQHRIARRTTEVDISLNMLDRGQTAAARLFQQLASHSTAGLNRVPVHDSSIWVPVARISRQTAEPIDIRDACGHKVPRLTQYETSRLLASGLYRLLRQSLTSQPNSANPDTDLSQVLTKIHEPRWLIQAALLTLFVERNRPEAPADQIQTPGTVEGHVKQYRKMALDILDDYATELKDYMALLNVALNEHLLVVALDATTDEHLLTYDSPLYVNKRSTVLQGLRQTLRASGEGYYVRYETSIPSTLRSYHLIFESAPGVDISRIFLSTDADAKAVESLESDLTFLAQRLKSHEQTPMDESARKLLELETQTALRRVGELVRRRRWEASHAGISIASQSLPASLALTQASVAGEAKIGADDKMNNSILNHPNVSPANLSAAAIELKSNELFYDLSLEGDPLTNRRHAYWRRAPERSVNSGQIKILAGAILQDATGAGPRDALFYASVLVGTTYLIACLLARSLWPYTRAAQSAFHTIHNPEAVIAVLLLVPGFLYSRLTLPDSHSVSGHLRAVPRFVARVCIFAMIITAAAIATTDNGAVIRAALIAGTLLPVISTVLLFRRRSNALKNLKKTLGRMGAPKWAGDERAKGRNAVEPDVSYSSVSHSSSGGRP